jgi:hypothetical protein
MAKPMFEKVAFKVLQTLLVTMHREQASSRYLDKTGIQGHPLANKGKGLKGL